MNYDWRNSSNVRLCSIRIKQAKIWLTKFDTVYIYSKQRLHESLIKLTEISDTCSFKNIIVEPFHPQTPIHFGVTNNEIFSNHNFLFKLHTTCNIYFPYLFLDADALIVDSLENLDDLFLNTRDSVFFIDHETNIPNETVFFDPFINSGVFLMNDPEHLIYNWKQIYKFSEKTNFKCKFPGSDQSMLKQYFEYISKTKNVKKFYW
jgi:hypothetical protein